LPKYNRSDAELDQLYEATFLHADNGKGCNEACRAGVSHSISLTSHPPDQDDPITHYGLIPSAGPQVGDAMVCDRLAAKEEVLCFEMEAAGLKAPKFSASISVTESNSIYSLAGH
jgi:hypothetical protein